MKVSLRWLQEYVDLPTTDPEKLALSLAQLGHEVEQIERLDAPFTGIEVARVESIRAHPDADKIRLVTVDRGGPTQEVVCGAWNFDVGATVALATVGAVLPGGFTITAREIRGVTSEGMICSQRELGMGDDHEGILVLPGDLKLGRNLVDYLELPDVVFDLSITSNRPDAMGMVGIARELAAKYQVELREPVIEIDEHQPPTQLRIEVADRAGCPRFVGREVRGVTWGPSPLVIQQRLRAAGVRPISNIVDTTNYVMLELGHPTHVFDLDELAGEQLRVHRAAMGDTLVTLDGVERKLDPGDIVISDGDHIVSLAGIMGGGPTEASEKTSRVLVEAAHWDPPAILYSSKRHGLRSEASARFERGVDPNLSDRAAARVTQLLVQHAGGEAAAHVVDVYPEPVATWSVELPIDELERVLGITITGDVAGRHLESLGMVVNGTDPLQVEIPTFRPDVTRPIDLVEEVARLHGYDNIPETLPLGVGGGLTPEQRRQRLLGAVLTGAGLTEANTLSFMNVTDLDVLALPADDIRRDTVRVKNPLSADEETLRTTLLPGLLRAAARNLSHGLGDIGLFETGRVFFRRQSDIDSKIPDQPHQLALVLSGRTGHGLVETGRAVDIYDLTAVIETLAARLGCQSLALRQASLPGHHPGRAAEVLLEGQVVGIVGELHPAAARELGFTGRVVVAEMDLDAFLAEPPWWEFAAPSRYPPIVFDLAFEMDGTLAAADLLAELKAAAPEIERVELFDEYYLGGNRKSLAARVVLRATDHTMTDEEAAPIRARIITTVEEGLDVKLRGG